ncbi:Phosphatidylinositol-specific phospholipase C domain-containing protein [Mycena kentingensis (nom. inval.)]|nr:Phosphatidylinositol-specific phospholipase C domain-containing protein [Mycena kentingensis (nom. inval.)]
MRVSGSITLVFLFTTVLATPVKRADESFKTLRDAANADWMAAIDDATSLGALSIPGTHESMAIHGGPIAECQEELGDGGEVLTAQMNAGVRAFDVRLRIVEDSKFTIHHGLIFQEATFDNVLDKFDAFLAAHPKEVLMVRIKQECTGEVGSCTDVEGQKSFTDIFDDYMNNSPSAQRSILRASVDRNRAAALPTLGEARGKVIVMVVHGTFGGRVDSYGLEQFSAWNGGDSEFVQDEFEVKDPGAIEDKANTVRTFLDKVSGAEPTNLAVNFASGSSILALPEIVAGGLLGIEGVNENLLAKLNDGSVKRSSIIMMDFPGSALINKILSFNPNAPAPAPAPAPASAPSNPVDVVKSGVESAVDSVKNIFGDLFGR